MSRKQNEEKSTSRSRTAPSVSKPRVKPAAKQAEGTEIKVEDDRTGMSTPVLKRAFLDNLQYLQGKDFDRATTHDFWLAEAYTVRDRLIRRWIETQGTYYEKDVKRVCYLSAEFLMGRLMRNNLVNLGIYDSTRAALGELGIELADLLEQERDAGLGNGGLGRLAACFLDSMATLGIPGIGYGLRYEFGIFEQRIENGYQTERPDQWLKYGNPWEIARPEYAFTVKYGGRTEAFLENGVYRIRWIDTKDVLGVPFDTPIAGYRNNTVNTLRLWQARATVEFDFQEFDQGDYEKAVQEKTESENISKVLYPNDNSMQGKELRLKQQYFFVSCSLQDIIRRFRKSHKDWNKFPERVAIQLNDTHPTLAIPELMRLLLDEHGLDWAQGWEITRNTFGYTNHTLLPEALEKWPVSFFERLLPRHLEIIYEINSRFLDEIRRRYPGELDRVRKMSIIEENPKMIRMAHVAVIGSYSVNGVAALHTELLKTRVLTDFAQMWPERFNNKTNGVTPRRWILNSNPGLSKLLDETVGDEWPTNLLRLEELDELAEDASFRDKFRRVKRENKQRLADFILSHRGVEVNLDSIFDVQIKRFHEYKRQQLNCLHIIHLYNELKKNPKVDIVPRTFVFAGKAAPGYFLAKRIIKLINSVAEVVNSDPDVAGRLKVVFLENYSVSLGELMFPAADLSEQISTAGYEASGTGNMKFALNGAVTIGTLDGANVEIRQCVGHENFFLFGLTADEVVKLRASGYNPYWSYESSTALREVIDRLAHNHFARNEPGIFHPILDELLSSDRFMVMADFNSYVLAQGQVSNAFRDRENWTKIAIRNVARTGTFSSDRTIQDYAREIWKAKQVRVDLPEYDPAAV
ncbi:MAG: glycogen/starch/alpha-glucan phosphorylase [Armatimonadetes bacterium]|nr:glycogen/starch/alpha-glucan phosphorylase [Armatimonadota bacterium]